MFCKNYDNQDYMQFIKRTGGIYLYETFIMQC